MSHAPHSADPQLPADLLARLRAEDSLAILDLATDGIGLALPGPWRIVHANAQLARWIGPPQSGDSPERSLADVFTALGAPESRGPLDALWNGEIKTLSFSTALLDRSGLQNRSGSSTASTLPVRLELRRITLGEQTMVAIITQAIHSPGEAAERLDSLTGLADRSFVIDRLTARLASERAADHQFAVLFIDLDNFKWINDTYGHLMGDRVLCEVARRLSSCVRAGDRVARFGGDEFVVLVDFATSGDEVEPIVARIRKAFRDPVALPGREAQLSVSIGVAVAGPEYQTAEALLEAADRAMYASKGRKI